MIINVNIDFKGESYIYIMDIDGDEIESGKVSENNFKLLVKSYRKAGFKINIIR